MIIGACGFTGSGSSAVSDYLKEFQSVNVFDRMEFILSHSPDGLEDLKYQLNDHCSKYSSSEVAIHRFRQNVDAYIIERIRSFKAKRRIGELTDQYIKDISQVTWGGCGSADIQLHPSKVSRFIFQKARFLVTKMPLKIKTRWNVYPAHTMYFAAHVKNFDDITMKYVHDVLSALGADFSKPLVLNQPFSGTSPQLAFPFFDDPFAIVVDRDPRDLYISTVMSYVRHKGCYQIPSRDVEKFATYYRMMRDDHLYKQKNDRILVVRFEDMIYQYESTTSSILKFCGINRSDHYKQFFFPEKSIVNTQTFKRFPDLLQDILYIEKHLSDYLYDFERFGSGSIHGKLWT